VNQAPEHYFSARPAGAGDLHRLDVRLAGRPVRVQTAAGVFSRSRLDPGTAVLLDHVPAPPTNGDLLDLGCGWGPVALALALAAPSARVWGVDVNERALGLLSHNAAELGAGQIRACLPDDVPAGTRFAAIWSNPPVRIGKVALHDLLLRWLPRLDAGASAHLVVQRNLGSDSLHRWLADELGPRGFVVARSAAEHGYRVLRVEAPGGPTTGGPAADGGPG
jgi:16S rRNA (guanine1207-N2)-methyltransferase